MSATSSSYDSSELDDIDLAQPSRAVYESDVKSVFEQTRDYRSADAFMPTPRRAQASVPNFLLGPLPSQPDTASGATRRSADDPDSAAGRRPTSDSPHEDVASSEATQQQQGHAEPDSNSRPAAALHGGAGRVTVDLLSSAFVLDSRLWEQCAALGYTPADVITRRTCRGLGIDRSDLTFFEMREVSLDDLKTHGQYAVRVDRAGFSLRGVEDLMNENASLQSNNTKCTESIESMQALLRQLSEERSQIYLKAEEHQADLRRLQERCRLAEGHVKLLKQHVARSDGLYSNAKQQLDSLKQEVLEMTRCVPKLAQAVPLSARRHAAANSGPNFLEPHKSGSGNGLPVEGFMDLFKQSWDGSQHRLGSVTSRSSKPSPAAMERVLGVMEQFSHPHVMAKLEQLLLASETGVAT